MEDEDDEIRQSERTDVDGSKDTRKESRIQVDGRHGRKSRRVRLDFEEGSFSCKGEKVKGGKPKSTVSEARSE